MKLNSLRFNFRLRLPFLVILIANLFAFNPLAAQIFEPEGLNMPGTYNEFFNPPTNLVFSNPNQSSGGKLVKITTGTARWQTIFSVASSGGDVVGGTYDWLFTSGPTSNYYNNKWAGVTVTMNTLQTYTHNNGNNNTITLTNGKWYTMNWKDKGYVDTEAIFIETEGQPVTIQSNSRIPSTVYGYQKPIVYANVSGPLPTGQGVYLRYTNNSWSSSEISPMALAEGNSYKVELPPYASGTSVQYYIFTSGSGLTISPADADLYTINLLNNGGSNYSYTVQNGTVRFTGISGNWSNTGTWENGIKPSATDQVVIQHNITFDESSTTTVNSLLINQGSQLTINSSQSMTITSELGNNGSLLIKSDAIGSGSLISPSGANATVERYIAAATWGEGDDGWHLISSPVAAQSITGSWSPTGENNDYDFYGWNESGNLWMNHKDAGFSTWNVGNNFNVGQGYMAAYQQTETKTFVGALNNAAVTKNNLSITSGDYSGWHLVGNPFSSAIDWNNANWVKTGLLSTAKVWVEADKAYKDVTVDYSNIIPSANGFWVKANNATNTLTIPLQARTHNSLNWLKSGASSGYIILTARDIEGNSAQESIIRIDPNATDGFDTDYDAQFMSGYAPMFYSLVEDQYVSLNTLPELENKIINLGFVKNNAQEFSIELNTEHNIPGRDIYLTDIKTGAVANLTSGQPYLFTSEEGDEPNRFMLNFSLVGLEDQPEFSQGSIYSNQHSVYISNTPTPADITLTNLTGQIVMRTKATTSGLTTLNVEKLPKGVYVVSVLSGGKLISRKVVL